MPMQKEQKQDQHEHMLCIIKIVLDHNTRSTAKKVFGIILGCTSHNREENQIKPCDGTLPI